MTDKEGEMSLGKLSMLGGLLLAIWALCYQAEQQLEPRRIQNTYNKLESRNVSEGSVNIAKNIALGNLENNYLQMQKQVIKGQYPNTLNAYPEQSICVVLTHEETNGLNELGMIKSILQQDYTNFKVIYFRTGGESAVSRYIEDNALDASKVKMLQNPQEGGYLADFLEGKTHCDKEQIILFLSDADRILGIHAFNLINNLISRAGAGSVFLYTASLDAGLGLGKSFPFPQEIIHNGTFEEYPFIAGGIIAFTKNLYMGIEKEDLTDEQGKFYQNTKDISFGLKMLKQAKEHIIYVSVPLLLDSNERSPLTIDPKIRAEEAAIKTKHRRNQ